MKRFRPILSAVLALLLVLPGTARAGDPPAAPMSTGLGEAPEVALPWDDGWFEGDPAQYNHDLTIAAMVLSGSAYAGRGAGVREGLRRLGFRAVQSFNYQICDQPDGGRAAYTFARRDLPDACLVAVVVRGTGEVTEWAGNLNVGTGRDHAGFAQAGDELLENLENYLAQEPDRPLRFLVTGHSRGGAVANLTAARLTAENRGAVYARTFAAPAVSLDGTGEGYENIFNITGPEDLVPQLPLAQWGYCRYGVDLPLPDRASWGRAYGSVFQEMRRSFRDLTGQNYVSYRDPAAVERMVSIIAKQAPAASGDVTAMLEALLRGDYQALSDLANRDGETALALGRTAVRLTAQLVPLLSQERDGLTCAHCMASYYCWLTVWRGEGPPEG